MFYEFNHPATTNYFQIETGKDFSFPAHIHECFEIITVTSGEMYITINTQTILIKRDEAVMVFPNQVHSLSSQNSEHILCIFSPHLVSSFAKKVSQLSAENVVFKIPKHLLEMMNSLNNSSSVFLKKGFLYLLCDSFDNGRKYYPRKNESKNLLGQIFLYVEKNYKQTCNLKNLCATLGYDYAYLSRYFKEYVGISFNSYINMYRLNNVCYLFENTKQNITDCAVESGYSSIRSFNRNFKNHFGITPTQYAQNIRKKSLA